MNRQQQVPRKTIGATITTPELIAVEADGDGGVNYILNNLQKTSFLVARLIYYRQSYDFANSLNFK